MWGVSGICSSLIFDIEQCAKDALHKFKRLERETVGLAVGHIDANKGISLPKNEATGHIEHVLFDWEHNSPYVDFTYP